MYKSSSFFEDIYNLCNKKESLLDEELCADIYEFYENIYSIEKDKQQKKVIAKQFSKRLSKKIKINLEELIKYYESIIYFLETKGEVKLLECLRIANEFNNLFYPKLDDFSRNKILRNEINFDKICQVVYYYEQNIKKLVSKIDLTGIESIKQLSQKFKNIKVIEEDNFILLHPKTYPQFFATIKTCLKEINDPKYKAISWCTQDGSEWESYNSDYHLLIFFSKDVHYDKELSSIEDSFKSRNYLNSYSMLSLKVYKDVYGEEKYKPEINYDGTVNIDNVHCVTEKDFKLVLSKISETSFDEFKSRLVSYCNDVVYEEKNEALDDNQEIKDRLWFFYYNNMKEECVKFFIINILSSKEKGDYFTKYAELILQLNDQDLPSSSFFIDLLLEIYAYLIYQDIEGNHWILTDFYRRVSPEIKYNYALDYYLNQNSKTSLAKYSYVILSLYCKNMTFDPEGYSFSTTDKAFIEPHMLGLIKKLKSANNKQYIENYCEYYYLNCNLPYRGKTFFYFDNEDINYEIFTSDFVQKSFNELLSAGKDNRSYNVFFARHGVLMLKARKKIVANFDVKKLEHFYNVIWESDDIEQSEIEQSCLNGLAQFFVILKNKTILNNYNFEKANDDFDMLMHDLFKLFNKLFKYDIPF